MPVDYLYRLLYFGSWIDWNRTEPGTAYYTYKNIFSQACRHNVKPRADSSKKPVFFYYSAGAMLSTKSATGQPSFYTKAEGYEV